MMLGKPVAVINKYVYKDLVIFISVLDTIIEEPICRRIRQTREVKLPMIKTSLFDVIVLVKNL